MRPRLTFIAYRLAPASGLERASVDLIERLAPDHDVSVVVLRGQPSEALCAGLSGTRVLTGHAALRGARRAIQSSEPVVMCGVWAAAALAVLGIGASCDWSNVAHWEHSLLPDRLRTDRRFGWVLRVADRSIRRAGVIVSVSKGVAAAVDELVGPRGQRSLVVPNIIELEERPRTRPFRRDGDAPAMGAETVRLLAVGSLRKLKNYDHAIRALAELPPNFALTVLGDGPARAGLETLSRSLGVHHRTTFLGHVDNVAEYLESADVLVHPSRSETFGLCLLEAAAWDVPVVTLDVAAIDEVVPQFVPGIRVTSSSPLAFAAAILAVGDSREFDRAAFDSARAARRQSFASQQTLSAWSQLLKGLRPCIQK